MKILVVGDDVPWPQKSGSKIRLANVVDALSEVGDLDLFLRAPPDYDGSLKRPDELPVRRLRISPGDPHRSTPRMLRRWLTTGLPRMVARADWTSANRDLHHFLRSPYDVVWFEHAASYVELGKLAGSPAIVDLDNLEDQKIHHLRVTRSGRGHRDPLRSHSREVAARTFDRFDERRWARLQQRITAQASAVTVCSEIDRERLASTRAHVLPNGYELPAGAERRRAPSAPPTPKFVLVGLLTYEPNADAAWFFADEVLPRVRAVIPAARLHLVGRYDHTVAPLGNRPGVELHGEVPDVGAELFDAGAVVVPMRYGAGTRIKVLEAFAWRVPVISTTVGFEGIAAVRNEHLLVADRADAFADACIALLRDPALRTRLVNAAYELWSEHYRWSNLRTIIVDLAQLAAKGAGR